MKFNNFLNENLNNYEIYLDMDGVLCNFLKGANNLFPDIDLDNSEKWTSTKINLWPKIISKGSKFWSELEWEKGGKKLWNFLKNYNVTILSAHPKTKGKSEEGKREWLRKNLGNKYAKEALITLGIEKQNYSGKNKILIDDTQKNISQWISKGGIGIKHTDVNKTINELKSLEVMSEAKKLIIESSDDIKSAAEQIAEYCKPYLKHKIPLNRGLYRGFSKNPEYIEQYRPIKNRVPVDITKDLHNRLNRGFKEKFGWNARTDGIFVTGDKLVSGAYGFNCRFFPIGEFKFIWSPEVWDLFDYLTGKILIVGLSGKKNPKQSQYIPGLSTHEKIIDDAIKSYTDKYLYSAIRSESEITIKCKTYYLVHIKYENELIKELKKII